MPIYEAECNACGDSYEVICRVAERENVVCACGATPHFLVSSANIIGAMPSKPIVVGNVGTFETNAEYRDYLKKNPNVEVISTHDTKWKRMLHKSKTTSDETVRKWGFRDTHHWSEASKKGQSKGGNAFTE